MSCISYTSHTTNKTQLYKTSLKCAYLNLPYGNTIFKKEHSLVGINTEDRMADLYLQLYLFSGDFS